MRRIGVVVNPVAGMGGRVGLKGTDGKVEQAVERGATPRAPDRATEAIESLARHAEADIEVLAAGGAMGADAIRATGVEPTIVYEPAADAAEPGTVEPGATTAEDTRAAVRAFVEHGVDLVVFVGGDGTAVDVATALDELGVETPMLGVPAGVKVYSSVFGVTPRDAGRIAATFERVEDREINDIDEDAYRGGEVETELRAVRPVPVAEDLQSSKQIGGGSVETLAEGFIRDIEPGTTYVLGPGSTVGEIKSRLGFEGSPLGVDVWRAAPDGVEATSYHEPASPAGEVLVRDATEADILDVLDDPAVIVVSPIGGQGFVFGRGNDQISPAVIERCDLEVVASRRKLDDLSVLRVDTDDDDLDESLRGWLQVRIGRFERRMMQVV
ncbi:Predicted polyphosphate- or ATP-dependent NAD kinase [Natronoarchaeum philippinense]|uniref:Predicted polyphosphate- or ATP-dependent NAD kinase n=1 Tax=Natronoarchaeum philippinense TaxID=558529 RepID=A0A285NUR3_NATPI|nr:ATP-NAD kinase family protein [Natronoarchaeum philippinense]SNZ13210.1 Predicted polyphosphate- or ATP-dependent NAD kinase [Natronoarchaeum philippinense]